MKDWEKIWDEYLTDENCPKELCVWLANRYNRRAANGYNWRLGLGSGEITITLLMLAGF